MWDQSWSMKQISGNQKGLGGSVGERYPHDFFLRAVEGKEMIETVKHRKIVNNVGYWEHTGQSC